MDENEEEPLRGDTEASANRYKPEHARPFSKSSMLAMASILASFGPYMYGQARQAAPPEERPCLQCGKPKQHNNSFCSAQCCRAYRDNAKRRQLNARLQQ